MYKRNLLLSYPYEDYTTFKMMVTLCIEIFFHFLAPSGHIDIRIKFSICSKVTKKVRLYESICFVKLLKTRTVFQGHINNLGIFLEDRFWLKRSAVALSSCTSNKFPGDINATACRLHCEQWRPTGPLAVSSKFGTLTRSCSNHQLQSSAKRKQSTSSYWVLN